MDLICIDCKNVRYAINALHYAEENSGIRFNNIKLLSSFNDRYRTIYQPVYIPKINNLDQYNYFIINELYKHIDSESVMIVQWDGFPLNKSKWKPEFNYYDYIGAPWFSKSTLFNRKVGNGGFSIRSKRLCFETAKNKKFIRNVPDNYNLKSAGYNFNAEDNLICIINKVLLESLGFNFAPFSVGREFSAETEPYKNHYGFHGFRCLNSLPEYVQDIYKNR